jgi:hypothetical protein
MVLGGLASADETSDAALKTTWDDRPWTMSMNLGFSPLGQLGLSLERSLTRNIAVAGGLGVDMLSGFPYDGGVRPRYGAGGRLRAPFHWGAVGVQLNASVGQERIKVDHATYDVLYNAVVIGLDAYFERRWDNGFTWRFLMGTATRVTYSECEGRCTEEDLDSPIGLGNLSVTLGWSF